MIRIKSVKEVKPQVSVGIMGYEHGMGVTHLSIALADYTSHWLHARTAVVEYGERDTLAGLSATGVAENFRRDGVDYFPAATSRDLGFIYNMNYEYIIQDLGCDSRSAREELMRCSRKLVVGSLCPWRKRAYYDYIQRLLKNMGNSDIFTFLALFEDKIEIKKCRRACKVQVKSIPFMEDPFCVSKRETSFLHSLV